jgi:hypothetical protein
MMIKQRNGSFEAKRMVPPGDIRFFFSYPGGALTNPAYETMSLDSPLTISAQMEVRD